MAALWRKAAGSRSAPSLRTAAPVTVLLVLFAYNVIQYVTLVFQTPRQLDFYVFWLAPRIGLAQGWAQMYNPGRFLPELVAQTGNWLPYLNPPVFAWLLLPLSLLPYGVALVIWNAFILGCLVVIWRVTVWRAAPTLTLPQRGRDIAQRGREILLLLAALALYPVVLGLALGQVTMVVLVAVALCYWLMRRDRPLLAGLVLALIVIKPQAAFLVPVALLAARRYRVCLGFALAVIPMAALSLLAVGRQGIDYWLASVAVNYNHPGFKFNSVSWIIGPGVPAIAVGLAAVAATLYVSWKAPFKDVELPIAAGLIGSLLVTPYVTVHDLSALVVAAWLVLRLDPPRWVTALLVVGYVPLFLANANFAHLPVLLLEGAFLVSLVGLARVRAKTIRPQQTASGRSQPRLAS